MRLNVVSKMRRNQRVSLIAKLSVINAVLVSCSSEVRDTKFSDLVNAPEVYTGSMVSIEGAAVVQFERSFICENPASVDRAASKCVWLAANYEVEGLDHAGLRRFERKMIRVDGLFSTESRGHLSQYVGEIKPFEIVSLGSHSAGGIQRE